MTRIIRPHKPLDRPRPLRRIRTGRDELYDMTADPLEQNNRAADYEHLSQGLKQRLAAWADYEQDHLPKLNP